MSDLRSAIRNAMDHHRPPDDWLPMILEGVRVRRRRRRLVAGGVGLAVPLILLVWLATELVPTERRDLDPAGVCGAGTIVGPTAWWRGNGSVTDAVGARKAVLRGDAAFAPGLIAEGFVLDGHDDFVEVPDDVAPRVGARDFTVALWVRFTSTRGEQVLIEDWKETFEPSTSSGWTLTKLPDDSIGMAMGAGGAVDTDRLDLPVDTWIHVAGRRLDGVLSIFVDGALIASESMLDPELAVDSDASLKFGHRGGPDDTPGSLDDRGFYLDGEVDEVGLFVGRGLSNEAIRRMFDSRSPCVQ